MSGLECGIVILPPANLVAGITGCQRSADPAFVPSDPPHITVKALFRCQTDDATLSAAIARVCRHRAPLVIHFDGLQSFPSPSGHILYLAVQPTRALRSLHVALLRVLTPLTEPSAAVTPGFEGANYRPHLTLLTRVPHEHLEEARIALAGLSPSASFTANEISLICRQPDLGASWLAPHTFLLGRPTVAAPDPANPICSA